MKKQERVLWGIAILLADLVIFIMPLAAVLLAYVIFFRPDWFKKWVEDIYSGE